MTRDKGQSTPNPTPNRASPQEPQRRGKPATVPSTPTRENPGRGVKTVR